MDVIREWAVALCAAAVLCAAAGMLTPEERSGRGMKIIFASVMLCAVIIPISQLSSCDLRSSVRQEHYEPDRRLCAAIEEQTAMAMNRAVRDLVEDCLQDLGVNGADITVSMDISEDGCISIGQVTVSVPQIGDTDTAAIASELYSSLGLEAEVTSAEEEAWN